MKCLISNESSEKSLCDHCRNKKRCRDCKEMKSDSKTDFYLYKNGKMYSTCKVCFNKKVMCEICNKEVNKSYLRSHIKKQHMRHNYIQNNYQPRMQWHIQQQRYEGSGIGSGVYNAPSNAVCGAACVIVSGGRSGGPSGGSSGVAFNSEKSSDSENKRTILASPSFCGKFHLLLK